MKLINEFLDKFGLTTEDLDKDPMRYAGEKETLNQLRTTLTKNQISVTDVRDFINKMKFDVEKALTEIDHNSNQDLFLKARLKNLIELSNFLDRPERARKAVEKAIEGMTPVATK